MHEGSGFGAKMRWALGLFPAMSARHNFTPPGMVIFLGALLAGAGVLSLGPRHPEGTRTPASILASMTSGPHDGLCNECHTTHGGALPQLHALIGPDDNSLCDGCHTVPWKGGSYPGTWLYLGSDHGSRSQVVWPGPVPPQRMEPGAANKCLNCHDPHGQADASGPIPSLTHSREEGLCLACHDGQPAQANILADLQKPYRHPTTSITGLHFPAESSPSDFGASPVNRRHAECEDCHNPHVARSASGADGFGRTLSPALLGVSRVAVSIAPPGSAPLYQFIPGSDTLSAGPADYQVCFKCHSSWTTLPPGKPDLAMLLNPGNASFHPVQQAGNNPNVRPGSFVGSLGALSTIGCGDCHGSDFGSTAGPHGSSNPGLLRQPSPASSTSRTMNSSELCFRCHSYDVYANRDAPESVQQQSRFSLGDATHAKHVSEKQVPCYACHDSHGSPNSAHLIRTGRFPGISQYTETPSGGSCTPTCHGTKSYTVSYGR